MTIEGVLTSLLFPAIIGLFLHNRKIEYHNNNKIKELEVKVAELMKREEIHEHVEKQINGVKELIELDRKHVAERLEDMHEDIKTLLKRE